VIVLSVVIRSYLISCLSAMISKPQDMIFEKVLQVESGKLIVMHMSMATLCIARESKIYR
jgi:hypothetical protein